MVGSGKIEFIFTEKQREFLNDRSVFKLLRAGRGFGKSYLVRKKAVLDCITCPHIYTSYEQKPVVSILGKHGSILTQIHWNTLKRECETIYAPLVKNIHTQERRIEFKGNKPDLILRGLDTGSTGDNLRGLSFYRTYVDEAQEVALLELLEGIIKPRMETAGSTFTAIFTPKGFTNDTYRLAQIFKETGEGKEFHYTSYDNPFRKAEELDRMKLSMPIRLFKQEILAEYTVFEGQIFDAFSLEKNVYTPESSTWLHEYRCFYITTDNGSRNPAIMVVGLKVLSDNTLTLEVIETWENESPDSVTVDTVITIIEGLHVKYSKYSPVFRVYIPDDRPDIVLSLRKSNPNINAACVNRNKPGVQARIDITNTAFNVGSLRIVKSDNTAKFIKQVISYHRATIKGIIIEKPAEGQEDHLINALMYLTGQVILPDAHKFKIYSLPLVSEEDL